MRARRRMWMGCAAALALALAAGAEVNQNWFARVPAKDRARVNPYAGQAQAIAAGERLFKDHCAACHGADLEGTRGRPSLRTAVVENAKDGELFWLLKNGDLRDGMPSWSTLPEPERWEIVAYLRSGGKGEEPGAGSR